MTMPDLDTRLAFHAQLRPERQQELLALRQQRAAAEAEQRAAHERQEQERQLDEGRLYLRQFAGRIEEEVGAPRAAIAAIVREAQDVTEIAALIALEARLGSLGAEDDPQRQAWEEARSAALSAQGALLSRLAGLHADAAVVTFCAARLQAAAAICDRIAEMLGGERWVEAAAIAVSAQQLCDALLAQSQERQLLEEQRASLVAGLLDGLRQQGLTVLDPELLRSGDLDAPVVLHVRRALHPITVEIDLSGAVRYRASGSDNTLWLVAHKAHHTVADGYGFDLSAVSLTGGA